MNYRTNAIRVRNAEGSPLLALPDELRNGIYRHVLLEDEIRIDFKVIHQTTSLLRTSSQLREEALVIYYGENVFFVTDAVNQERDVKHFLQMGENETWRTPRFLLRLDVPPEWTAAHKIIGKWTERGLTLTQGEEAVGRILGSQGQLGVQFIDDVMSAHYDSLLAIAADVF